MVSSMTGYGRAEKEYDSGKVIVEISSVNNRFLEFQLRLPKNLSELEQKIKKLIGQKMHRGKIYLSITVENESNDRNDFMLDSNRADMYYGVLKELKERFNLAGQIALSDFVNLPDLITVKSQPVDLEKSWAMIEPVLLEAAENIKAMRLAEGQAMANDLLEKLDETADKLEKIKRRFADNRSQYLEKLKKRIGEISAEIPIDEQRLATETAIIADRLDITEEIVRLQAHLDSFRETLQRDDAVGKKLTFILQEIYREANTIGAKSVDYEISSLVIDIKEATEKLREQIQNIE